MSGRGLRAWATCALTAGALALTGCGESGGATPSVKVPDQKIVTALDLQKADGDYAIGGDTTCLVSTELLNTSGEVDGARAKAKVEPFVVEAESGGYGVVGQPIFPPECAQKAVKALAKVKLPKK